MVQNRVRIDRFAGTSQLAVTGRRDCTFSTEQFITQELELTVSASRQVEDAPFEDVPRVAQPVYRGDERRNDVLTAQTDELVLNKSLKSCQFYASGVSNTLECRTQEQAELGFVRDEGDGSNMQARRLI